ncbi:helix-turn-helix domain-containing protein [Pseudothermotoga thermarum]|uniref:Sigma54 specific transcriptional regulator, Fis family n=1 Tax=Pseudothermotoga thermarum DSM 5069 TaxID=688269 RepID=F7YYM1_9THEM|nr:helix-turn-helix domain-containing protein [Pseudothermotoga thermarum]AEH51053.1 sigma54 specific transcriptional regulator, Fis family [Pseudothermotoga thermarum DSM 5069]
MIRVLLPWQLSSLTLPTTLEKIHVEFYVDQKEYERKLMEDFWDIIYGPFDERQRSAVFVSNVESFLIAIKYVEIRSKFDECKRTSDILDKHIELQGVKIVETLKTLKKLQIQKPDCFVIVAENGIQVEAYVDYFSNSCYQQVAEKLYKVILDGKKVDIITSSSPIENLINVSIPPLRERKEDIPYMVDKALSWIHQKHKNITVVFPDQHVMRLLTSYNWPGNTEELVRVIYRYASGEDIISCLKDSITVDDIKSMSMREYVSEIVAQVEKQLIQDALQKTSWNRKKAAAMLGLNYKTLSYKIKKYGIKRTKP